MLRMVKLLTAGLELYPRPCMGGFFLLQGCGLSTHLQKNVVFLKNLCHQVLCGGVKSICLARIQLFGYVPMSRVAVWMCSVRRLPFCHGTAMVFGTITGYDLH